MTRGEQIGWIAVTIGAVLAYIGFKYGAFAGGPLGG